MLDLHHLRKEREPNTTHSVNNNRSVSDWSTDDSGVTGLFLSERSGRVFNRSGQEFAAMGNS